MSFAFLARAVLIRYWSKAVDLPAAGSSHACSPDKLHTEFPTMLSDAKKKSHETKKKKFLAKFCVELPNRV